MPNGDQKNDVASQTNVAGKPKALESNKTIVPGTQIIKNQKKQDYAQSKMHMPSAVTPAMTSKVNKKSFINISTLQSTETIYPHKNIEDKQNNYNKEENNESLHPSVGEGEPLKEKKLVIDENYLRNLPSCVSFYGQPMQANPQYNIQGQKARIYQVFQNGKKNANKLGIKKKAAIKTHNNAKVMNAKKGGMPTPPVGTNTKKVVKNTQKVVKNTQKVVNARKDAPQKHVNNSGKKQLASANVASASPGNNLSTIAVCGSVNLQRIYLQNEPALTSVHQECYCETEMYQGVRPTEKSLEEMGIRSDKVLVKDDTRCAEQLQQFIETCEQMKKCVEEYITWEREQFLNNCGITQYGSNGNQMNQCNILSLSKFNQASTKLKNYLSEEGFGQKLKNVFAGSRRRGHDDPLGQFYYTARYLVKSNKLEEYTKAAKKQYDQEKSHDTLAWNCNGWDAVANNRSNMKMYRESWNKLSKFLESVSTWSQAQLRKVEEEREAQKECHVGEHFVISYPEVQNLQQQKDPSTGKNYGIADKIKQYWPYQNIADQLKAEAKMKEDQNKKAGPKDGNVPANPQDKVKPYTPGGRTKPITINKFQ